jgi:flagella basal body P-ring formation protein FlgA
MKRQSARAAFRFTRKQALLALPLMVFSSPAVAAGQQSPADVTAAVDRALAGTLPAGAVVTMGSAAGAAVMAACAVPLAVSLSGVLPYENAAVRCAQPGWTLYVPVTVTASELVVVAARPVAAGQTLGPGDVAVRREAESAYTGQAVFYDPAAVEGAVAMLSLPAGAILTGNDVQAPVLIKAGQTVAVDVRSGGVEVSIDAVASEAGRLGDTIMLENPSSGRRFTAVVTAQGPVVQLQP